MDPGNPADSSTLCPFPQSPAEIHDDLKLRPSVSQQQRWGDLRLVLGACRGGFYGCGVFNEVGWSLESPPSKVFLFPSLIPCSLISPPQTPGPRLSPAGNNTTCDFSLWSYIVIADLFPSANTYLPEAYLLLSINTLQSLIYLLLSISCLQMEPRGDKSQDTGVWVDYNPACLGQCQLLRAILMFS